MHSIDVLAPITEQEKKASVEIDVAELAKEGKDELIEEIMSDVVAITYKGAQIRCKTLGQQKYVRAMQKNTVVFGVGPAGTGKTYLAMANAVMAFKNKEISKALCKKVPDALRAARGSALNHLFAAAALATCIVCNGDVLSTCNESTSSIVTAIPRAFSFLTRSSARAYAASTRAFIKRS